MFPNDKGRLTNGRTHPLKPLPGEGNLCLNARRPRGENAVVICRHRPDRHDDLRGGEDDSRIDHPMREGIEPEPSVRVRHDLDDVRIAPRPVHLLAKLPLQLLDERGFPLLHDRLLDDGLTHLLPLRLIASLTCSCQCLYCWSPSVAMAARSCISCNR